MMRGRLLSWISAKLDSWQTIYLAPTAECCYQTPNSAHCALGGMRSSATRAPAATTAEGARARLDQRQNPPSGSTIPSRRLRSNGPIPTSRSPQSHLSPGPRAGSHHLIRPLAGPAFRRRAHPARRPTPTPATSYRLIDAPAVHARTTPTPTPPTYARRHRGTGA